MQEAKSEYLPVREAARLYPFYSEAAFRWLISRAEINGFEDVVIRIQGRVFIKRSSFEKWLKSHQQKNK